MIGSTLTVPCCGCFVITTVLGSKSPSLSLSFAVTSIMIGVSSLVSALSSTAIGLVVISITTVAGSETLPALSLTVYSNASGPT